MLGYICWKIKLSRPWNFDNDSCRLCVISHLYWWSNSEVFVDVWLFLDKSIGEFWMLYKTCVPWYGLGPIITIWSCNWVQLYKVCFEYSGYASHFLFYARLVTCKSTKKWYQMRMCISWLSPFKCLRSGWLQELKNEWTVQLVTHKSGPLTGTVA